jgi:hypothetical protein
MGKMFWPSAIISVMRSLARGFRKTWRFKYDYTCLACRFSLGWQTTVRGISVVEMRERYKGHRIMPRGYASR